MDYASCLIQCVHARLRKIVCDDSDDWTPIAPVINESAIAAAQRWLRSLAEDKLRLTAFGSVSVVLRYLADVRFHRKDFDASPVISALLSIPRRRWTTLWHDMRTNSTLLSSVKESGTRRDIDALTSLATIRFGKGVLLFVFAQLTTTSTVNVSLANLLHIFKQNKRTERES